MPHVALEKLFRSRQVRVCLDAAPAEGSSPGQGQQRMRRIARDATLSPGMQLLIPKAALQPAPEHCQTDTACAATGKQGKALAAKMRACMLYMDDEVIVLNKAAGMPVQSGTDLPLAVDQVLAAHFVSPEGHQPRLVHRLDMAATGALAVARTPDAATWLAAAFARPAIGLATDATEARQLPSPAHNGGPWVRKLYWTIVHTSHHLPPSGTIDMPLPGGNRAGSAVPTVTHYTVKGSAAGLAWLECELVTGRKHQIRMHCAKGLRSPIVGDQRYGSGGDPGVRDQVQHLHGNAARTWSKHLQLHCRDLSLCKGGQHQAIHVAAPPPEHMLRVLSAHGWTI